MLAERKLEITLILTEEEAHLMITGLSYGTMHVRDHIHTDTSSLLIDRINKLSGTIRKAMNVFG